MDQFYTGLFVGAGIMALIIIAIVFMATLKEDERKQERKELNDLKHGKTNIYIEGVNVHE